MAKPKFDPDKPYVKIRGMGSVHYEQDGHKFNAGHKHVERLDAKRPGGPKDDSKDAVRARAQKKIAAKKKRMIKKKPDLTDYSQKKTPDAVSSAVKENEAAKAAEEHAE